MNLCADPKRLPRAMADPAEGHVSSIVDEHAPARVRFGAVHRLTCELSHGPSRRVATQLARRVRSPALWEALRRLLLEGDPLSVMVVELMQWLALDDEGLRELDASGVLPLLIGALRASDEELRCHGMPLLVAAASLPEIAPSLERSKIVELLDVLGRSGGTLEWHWILTVTDSLLCDPFALSLEARRALGALLLGCPVPDALAASDSLLLQRALAELQVTTKERAAGRTRPPLTQQSQASQPGSKLATMSDSMARAMAAANAATKTQTRRRLTAEERDRAWSLEEGIREAQGAV